MSIYFEHHLQQHIYFDIYQQEILQLNIEKTMSLEIGIYDVLGKKVQQIENNKYLKGIHNISFDTTNLESGTYFIKYQSNEMVNNVKFVVSH